VSEPSSAELAEHRKRRRRLVGSILIAASVVMLFLGNFVLEEQLSETIYGFVIFWSVCFLLALMALFTALFDMVAVRRDAARERLRLVQETFVKGKGNAKAQETQEGDEE